MGHDIIIAIDAMGGDNAPAEIIKGCMQAIKENELLNLIMVGKEDLVNSELSKYQYNKSQIRVENATENIGCEESPVKAIRSKKDSSLVKGLRLVKEKQAQAFISAGSSGAVLAGGTFIVGRIKGIERPALAPLIPTEKGYSLLIDCGANVDAKPSYFGQFAKMGSAYCEKILGIKNPKVGIINIGVEKGKGNSLVKEAYDILENEDINFVGNIEARDVNKGYADVLVCDAFVGNVILKNMEGVGKFLFSAIKKELMSSTRGKLGGVLLKPIFKKLYKSFDASEVGGAPLLGLEGLVVKAHGNSKARAIKNAIKQCEKFIENDVNEMIRERI